MLFFDKVGDSPAFRRMKGWIADWVVKCEGGDLSFGEGIAVQAVSRGLMRCSVRAVLSFSDVLFGLDGLRNILAVVNCANDSYVHFACDLFRHLDVKPSRDVVLDIICDAVLVEKDIVEGIVFCILLYWFTERHFFVVAFRFNSDVVALSDATIYVPVYRIQGRYPFTNVRVSTVFRC